MSHVTFFSSFFAFSFLDKVVELIGGRSVINGATPSSIIKCQNVDKGRGGWGSDNVDKGRVKKKVKLSTFCG